MRFQEHHKPGTRKKEPTIWHKDITIRLLDFGMQVKKFSPEAKADVEHKSSDNIDVYKKRLTSADWLAKETRDKAIVKIKRHYTTHWLS